MQGYDEQVQMICKKTDTPIFLLDGDSGIFVEKIISPTHRDFDVCICCSRWDDAMPTYTTNRIAGEAICKLCAEDLFRRIQESIVESGCHFDFDFEEDYVVAYQGYSNQEHWGLTFAPTDMIESLRECVEEEYQDGYGKGYSIRTMSGADLFVDIIDREQRARGGFGVRVLDADTEQPVNLYYV